LSVKLTLPQKGFLVCSLLAMDAVVFIVFALMLKWI
jgi:hypothetical protein